jgi:hypothetical protein
MRLRVALLLTASLMLPASQTFAQGAPNGIISSVQGANADQHVFYAFNLTNLERLVASVKFTDVNQKTKVTFIPLTLASSQRTMVNTIVLNFAQDGGVSTFGAGFSLANSLGYNKRADAIWQRLVTEGKLPKPFRDQMQGESNDMYALLLKEYNDTAFNTVNDLYYAALAKNAWSVVIGTNISAFAVVGGDEVDQNEDGVIDNKFATKGFTHTAALSHTFSQATALTGSAYFGRRRAEAKADSVLKSYPGWSVSFAQTVIVLDKNYKSSTEYKEFGFIPAIVAGASYEQQRCSGEPTGCEKSIQRQSAFTPFVDIKLAQSTQFRLSVPIQRLKLIGSKTQADLGIAVQFALQLRNLN